MPKYTIAPRRMDIQTIDISAHGSQLPESLVGTVVVTGDLLWGHGARIDLSAELNHDEVDAVMSVMHNALRRQARELATILFPDVDDPSSTE